MEFTGELYGFYSDKPIEKVFNLLENYASIIDYKFDYNILFDNKSIIFFKNDDMWQYHLENGYNTDLNGEGCFSIETKVVNLNGKAKLYEFDGDSNFDPFDVAFVVNSLYYYVLIVPDLIESNGFSNKIYTDFYNLLKEV